MEYRLPDFMLAGLSLEHLSFEEQYKMALE